MEIFNDFFKKYYKSRLAFVTHSKADIDSVASAYVLKKKFKNAVLLIPEETNYSAGKLIEKFGIKFETLESIDITTFDGVVAVDTSNYGMFHIDKKVKIVAVFDHHQKAFNSFEGEFNFIDPDARATAEIIATLFETEMDKEDATLLGAAIISDTARFKSAKANIFNLVNIILSKGIEYNTILNLAYPPLPYEEKVNLMHGMQRLEFFEHSGFIIATSIVSAKLGEVCSLLSEAADVSFTFQYDDKKNLTMVSARANPHFTIPLNTIMEDVGKKFKGSGGGHTKASGAFANDKAELVLEYCLDLIKKEIDKKNLVYFDYKK